MLDLSKAILAGQRTHITTPQNTERIIRAALPEIEKALADQADTEADTEENMTMRVIAGNAATWLLGKSKEHANG
jgi:hypothetical protein